MKRHSRMWQPGAEVTDQFERGLRLEAGSPEALLRALRAEGIRDGRVLEAFRRVCRQDFVPPGKKDEAYRDQPIRIAHGQVTTQPSLVARMVEALELTGTELVLEIGTGLGFQTAILAHLAAEVFSIERFADLAEEAKANLEHAGVRNVTIVVGDGTLGLPLHSPYDAIVVSAAALSVPPPLVEQLSVGGRLVHPIGPGGNEIVKAFRKEGDRLIDEVELTGAYFVRLVGEHGFRE